MNGVSFCKFSFLRFSRRRENQNPLHSWDNQTIRNESACACESTPFRTRIQLSYLYTPQQQQFWDKTSQGFLAHKETATLARLFIHWPLAFDSQVETTSSRYTHTPLVIRRHRKPHSIHPYDTSCIVHCPEQTRFAVARGRKREQRSTVDAWEMSNQNWITNHPNSFSTLSTEARRNNSSKKGRWEVCAARAARRIAHACLAIVVSCCRDCNLWLWARLLRLSYHSTIISVV